MRQVRSPEEQTCKPIIISFLFGSFTITLTYYELMWSIMQIARGYVVHACKSAIRMSLYMSEKQWLSPKQEAKHMLTMVY